MSSPLKLKQQNSRAELRLCVIVLAAGLVECGLVLFLKKPFPWVAIVPAVVPLFVAVFVIIPTQKKNSAR